MTLHAGHVYHQGSVSIGPPNPEEVRSFPISADVVDEVNHWLSSAMEHDAVYYFSIWRAEELVGQIFLHDINWQVGEALVGYHLFDPGHRGLGIGTRALTLLKTFVAENTGLAKLVIITSADNLASQRIAQKCNFTYVGVPREDPHGLVYQWANPSHASITGPA